MAKRNDDDFEDELADDELEDSKDPDDASEDEEDLDEQVAEMVKEFMGVPEVKGLVAEIAKDAARRAADAVRNEYANKLQKSMDERFKILEDALGLEPGDVADVAEGDGEGGADAKPETNQRLLALKALKKKANDDALTQKEQELADREKELRRRELDTYKSELVREQGLEAVAHLIHGDDEDGIDEAVLGAKKTLTQLRRGMLKEFKDKGWAPPEDELGGEGSGEESGAVPNAKNLRARFRYGGQETPGGITVLP